MDSGEVRTEGVMHAMNEAMRRLLEMKHYEPAQVESEIYRRWMEADCFRARNGGPRKPYVIVIPPPNVTGKLHMGHALNNTIQDILIRWRRMQGYEALWLPGTDHAGIATQNVVEKKLRAEGKDRRRMGREAFEREVWKWKEEYGNTIIEQLKRLGASCDWSRLRFTLDEGLSRAVRKVFVSLYEEGLIYKGDYIINWCPRCLTALSDIECEHREVEGHLWHIRYPGEDGSEGVVVATTRPETMLGDVAVAVHPDDERYKHLHGKRVILPLMERPIPVICDPILVDPRFGTGCVKITPAHDPNDFLAGQRNGLTPLNVMNEDATINENGGPYAGLDRYEARGRIVEDLRRKGLLVKIEPHTHSVAHCYRCDTVIEPYLSTQWFVKMKPLAEPAIEAVRSGRIRFVPESKAKIYFDWMENIRDWCISRQLWWGHRIPAWTCRDCGELVVSEEDPSACPKCGGALDQDEDVLDTWFSSALWPFSTMGWPDDTEDMRDFYPTDVLVTDRGIINFWVARMIMTALHFTGRDPFHHVYIHGTILDKLGRKMSKSLGNGIDPIEMIERYGADAMRFSLMMLSAGGQDIKLSEDKFEMGRNFANKLANAARFLVMKCDMPSLPNRSTPGEFFEAIGGDALELEDRWILSRTARCAARVEKALEEFDFFEAVHALYEFAWNEYCDWYVEFVKERLSPESPGRNTAVECASFVFYRLMGLLHPFMPHLTEWLYGVFRGFEDGRPPEAGSFLMRDRWPSPGELESLVDEEAERTMERVQSIVKAVRTIRAELKIPPAGRVPVTIITSREWQDELLASHASLVKRMARIGELEWGAEATRPRMAAVAVESGMQICVALEGLVDPDAERRRLEKELARERKRLEQVEAKLSNEAFLEKAAPHVVELQRERARKHREKIEQLRKVLSYLGD